MESKVVWNELTNEEIKVKLLDIKFEIEQVERIINKGYQTLEILKKEQNKGNNEMNKRI